MKRIQNKTPLFTALKNHIDLHPISFHVPGHKNGSIFPNKGKEFFQNLLKLDQTEISGLDDLHQPEEAIKEAQQLTADLYDADHSFFLVGGSTLGNLSMVMAVCNVGDKIIVQRNSHKSIINALELAGALPIFLTPQYEESTNRHSYISLDLVHKALNEHPDVKAIVLTYPDYFGHTYPLESIIKIAHQHKIPVLVDEAHGSHFMLGDPFPPSALDLGADIVVQSAHKMLPAMTMGSILHLKGSIVSKDKVEYYLQMLQSSSPSYPIMASLDLARYYISQLTKKNIDEVLTSVYELRDIFKESKIWETLDVKAKIDDPLKITLHINKGLLTRDIVKLFEEQAIYPELSTTNQILFIHGLSPFPEGEKFRQVMESISKRGKDLNNHDTIDVDLFRFEPVKALPYSYGDLNKMDKEWVSWDQAQGRLAGQAVIPYPPGIPLLLKGEEINSYHIDTILKLIKLGQHFHYQGVALEEGLTVLK
ncbi:lysine decarboxylase [Salirhabdus euzebyi]|uniref:Lysine decarboxylase n=1 Tax=Salirhabdus euzebyi TaxID=394506 RepID=A0A841Q9P1_9BACI|nr:aminotransferase class I/II-fold pyridoxal phosphate-dependent enzyme [Salirhabdus euzebyi]MBB6455221.1 lysine decarboxylase [Salirhabdus euzebyi]